MSKKYIHAIHSVKGGSGKSSFSFALATKLCSNKNVLLVDADIRGTSLEKCFVESKSLSSAVSIAIEEKNKKTFNDLIDADYINWNDYISKCLFLSQNTEIPIVNSQIAKEFDILFSSSKYKDKRKYLYNSDGNNTQKISVERFKDRFNGFINLLKNDSLKNYGHIIFDMSPSSDEYTQSMLDAFENFDKDDEIGFIHYIIVTDDPAHMKATEEYLKDLLDGSIRKKRNDKIIVVFNQNYPEYAHDSNTNYINKIEKFIKNLKDIKIDERKISNITFLYSKFNRYYFNYIRSNLSNSEREFEDFVIDKYSISENEDNKLIDINIIKIIEEIEQSIKESKVNGEDTNIDVDVNESSAENNNIEESDKKYKEMEKKYE